MKMQVETDIITINSGETLLEYLKKKNMNIDHISGIKGSDNCIFLPDKTSFNWKSKSGIRVNCKDNAKAVIERKTKLEIFDNGKGDKTRDFSLIVDNQEDLDAVIDALAGIEGNANL